MVTTELSSLAYMLGLFLFHIFLQKSRLTCIVSNEILMCSIYVLNILYCIPQMRTKFNTLTLACFCFYCRQAYLQKHKNQNVVGDKVDVQTNQTTTRID